ncbi:hypothetical protein EDB86DRAFT_2246364 [Lactarius hatsudake]|nr:hypothetical protein EDB86DRAFT_2246364 [Lactarius hatsudake]
MSLSRRQVRSQLPLATRKIPLEPVCCRWIRKRIRIDILSFSFSCSCSYTSAPLSCLATRILPLVLVSIISAFHRSPFVCHLLSPSDLLPTGSDIDRVSSVFKLPLSLLNRRRPVAIVSPLLALCAYPGSQALLWALEGSAHQALASSHVVSSRISSRSRLVSALVRSRPSPFAFAPALAIANAPDSASFPLTSVTPAGSPPPTNSRSRLRTPLITSATLPFVSGEGVTPFFVL